MTNRIVIIAGATGLIGRTLLRGLLADPTVDHVHVVGRRAPPDASPKLTAHVVDFAALPALPPADELYLALGTTIKVAGSQAAFRAVDHDANLAVAKAALASGTKRVGLVSAMGADAKSRVFYSRVKGELEDELTALPFEGLVIARPSLLVGARAELGGMGQHAEQDHRLPDSAELQADRSVGRRECAAIGRSVGRRDESDAVGRDASMIEHPLRNRTKVDMPRAEADGPSRTAAAHMYCRGVNDQDLVRHGALLNILSISA